MRGRHIWAALAIILLVVGLAGWLILSPGWAVGLAQAQVRQQLGRALDVRGGARLEFSPMAIRLDEVSIAAAEDAEGAFMTARSIRIPVSIGQLLTRSAELSRIMAEDAEVAFIIDDRGRPGWNFPASGAAGALDIEIARGSLRYFDARNNQAVVLGGINGRARAGAGGELTLNGTAEIAGRLARIEASVKSLARIHADGSPLDLAIETAEGAASFNGRLSTAKVLSLAGAATASSPDLRSAARWMGLKIEDGSSYKQVSVDGVLDSAGRAIAFRNAAVTIDGTAFSGDVVFDIRNAVPKLQAALAVPALRLESFLPASGAKEREWGTADLGFRSLGAFDAEVTIETEALTYGALSGVPARLGASLAGGKLSASAAVLPGPAASLILGASIDTTQRPPAVSFEVKAEAVEAGQVLPGLLGVDWLAGKGTFSANLQGAGQTQQQIIGTLKGTASLSLADATAAHIDLAAILETAAARILEGWQGSAQAGTPVAALTADVTVADGIASLGSFTLAQPDLSVTAAGEIDLLRRALDLRAEPKRAAAGEEAKPLFPVGIVITGSWDAPRIYPDVPGLLQDPARGFEDLKAMTAAPGN